MTRLVCSCLLCLALMLRWAPVVLAQPVDIRDERSHDLFSEIRCPVCSGQSIAESDVPVSIAIRDYVQARVDEGDSDRAIKQNLVERYGQDILFEPTLSPSTLPLWLAPWGALVFLMGAIWYYSGRSRADSN